MPGQGGRSGVYDQLMVEAAIVEEKQKREISVRAVRKQVEEAKRQDRHRCEAEAPDERTTRP